MVPVVQANSHSKTFQGSFWEVTRAVTMLSRQLGLGSSVLESEGKFCSMSSAILILIMTVAWSFQITWFFSESWPCFLQVLAKLNLCFTLRAYTNCFLSSLLLRKCLQYLWSFFKWFLIYIHSLEVCNAIFFTIEVLCELVTIIDEEGASKEGDSFANTKIFRWVPLLYLVVSDLQHTAWEVL